MPAVGEVRRLPAARALFVDERGMGLRATWHPERGIVNLSLWRDDRCVETFWLPVADAGRLVSFLVDGLADAAATATSALADATDERPAAAP
jgi:hypothetical protein